MSFAKRSLDATPTAPSALASKRTRMVQLPRLCDLPDGADIFANAHNAIKAREKGILRSRDAKGKYEEVREHRGHAKGQALLFMRGHDAAHALGATLRHAAET